MGIRFDVIKCDVLVPSCVYVGEVVFCCTYSTTIVIYQFNSAQGRSRRMWLDDVKSWTKLENYEQIKRVAEDRVK